MRTTAAASSPFPPHTAFVVQFSPDTDLARGCVVGRVEHVMSGQATRFTSLEELWTFMGRVLGPLLQGPNDS